MSRSISLFMQKHSDAAPHESLTCFIVDNGPKCVTKISLRTHGMQGGGASRLVLKDVKVPRENVLGRVNGAIDVFMTMMVPERLGTAAMTIGAARPALEIATGYTSRRKAFGKDHKQVPGCQFSGRRGFTFLDASSSMIYTTAKAVDCGIESRQE